MGLENFILTCEKDNESLRKDINYYKNYNKRLKKENQELKQDIKNLVNVINNNCVELSTTNAEYESLRRWNK